MWKSNYNNIIIIEKRDPQQRQEIYIQFNAPVTRSVGSTGVLGGLHERRDHKSTDGGIYPGTTCYSKHNDIFLYGIDNSKADCIFCNAALNVDPCLVVPCLTEHVTDPIVR